LLQRVETLRLYNWNQVLDTTRYLKPTFKDRYDPVATNGTVYAGTITTNVPSLPGAAYTNNMRTVTVTLFWTNYPHKPNTNIIVRSRQMQTYVARYGMQNYLYQ
jgi:hypothetical protein